jgi:predicted metalloprotease with PDZ domain
MWLFEGITDYYGDLALLRAGLISEERFLGQVSGAVRSFDLDPGARVTTVAMSSFDSWAKQDDPPPATFYSFYTAGKALGLALDLEVRGRTGGARSLDDVMRHLYDAYYLRGEGMPEDGFRRALETVTGTSFEAFFDAHVDSTARVDWGAFLAHAGFRLARRPDEARPVRLGIGLDGLKITSVRPGSGAFRAGLDVDDTIVAAGGTPVESAEALSLEGLSPGDALELTLDRWGERRTVSVVLDASDPLYAFEPVEAPTDLQRRIRADWLAAPGR